jgi:carbon monoxide dehydrogenase subunit G
MTSEHTVLISVPPERAFEFVADVGTWKSWALRVVDVRRERQGALAIGECFTVVAQLWGRHLPATYRVTEILEGSRLVFRSDSGPAPAVFTFTMRATEAGTLLTESVEISPRGLLKLFSRLLQRTSDKQLAANHAALKAALEAA